MSDEVLFEKRGRAGFMTLNRPKALNALNHGMVAAIASQLSRWADDPEVAHVVVTGTGEKAFCAGGDIRSIYDARMAGRTEGLGAFFRDEYLLNAQIKAFPKPYVSLIDGIVMGGGVGLSVHGSHRVGTERTLFAMPETGIGFFPDVGGSWFLPRMPKKSGYYCALSAGRLKQGDALATGVLTHAVAATSLADIEESLETAGDIGAVLAPHLVTPEPGEVAAHLGEIEEAFAGATVEQILSVLDESGSEFARKTAETIREKSPTSVLIAFEQLRRGGQLTFEECMRMEYRIVSRILKGTDFYEGVRAVLVDKDQSPRWQPSLISQVDMGELASYFEEPSGGDLPL